MKQTFRLLVLSVTFLSQIFFFSFSATAEVEEKKELVVYNWSEFIPQRVLDDFTKETGIHVTYSTFESNEAMFAKIKLTRGKSYDIVFPSGYFVGKMLAADLLEKLDHSKLPNIKNLDPRMLSLDFDKNNEYSLPYMWGTTGLAYNTKYIPKGSIQSWNDLLKPELRGRIILTDDLRDAFGLALLATGHSVSSIDPEAIKDAYEFLLKLKPSVRVFDVTAIKQALISEEVWIGPIWNGDFLVAQEENELLDFVLPKEGGVGWVDNFVILKDAVNKENAYTFINYLLRPEVAALCVEEFKYSTPNKAALALLPPELTQNPVFAPSDEDMEKTYFPDDIGDTLLVYEKYWEALKTAR